MQNLALNYDEDNNIFHNNLIKVPESFYKKIFKRNSINISELDTLLNKNRKMSDASSSAFEVNISMNSFIVTKTDIKITKTPEKATLNELNKINISSFEDSNGKIAEKDKKILKPSEISFTKKIEMQYELERKLKKEKTQKEDQLLKEKISKLIKKENAKEENSNNKYQQILKNVQGSSFFSKIINDVKGSESMSPTNNFKRTNIRSDCISPAKRFKDKVLSNKSKEEVNFRENGTQEKIIFQSNSFKNFTLNDIKNVESSGYNKQKETNKDDKKISNFENNNSKAEDIFANYHYHDYINKKFNNSSSTKSINKNKLEASSNKNNSYNKLQDNSISNLSSVDYYKLYNIKRSEDHDAYGNIHIFDSNLVNKDSENNKKNQNKKQNHDYIYELNQEDKLIFKLKNFVIELPNDDDHFNQDFFEKKTPTLNGFNDKYRAIENDSNKKNLKRRSYLPDAVIDKQTENESFYSKKIYRNHESNIFGMFNNL